MARNLQGGNPRCFFSQSTIAVLVKRFYSYRALGAIGHGGPRAGSLGMNLESLLSVNAKTVFARVVLPSAKSLTASTFRTPVRGGQSDIVSPR